MNRYKKSGWFNESQRHSLARQGIKTGRKKSYTLGKTMKEGMVKNGNLYLKGKGLSFDDMYRQSGEFHVLSKKMFGKRPDDLSDEQFNEVHKSFVKKEYKKTNYAKKEKIVRGKTCDNEILFSPLTSETFSACAGDYWNVSKEHVFKDSEGNTMQLVQTGYNELGNQYIKGVIKEKVKKKDLLDIV